MPTLTIIFSHIALTLLIHSSAYASQDAFHKSDLTRTRALYRAHQNHGLHAIPENSGIFIPDPTTSSHKNQQIAVFNFRVQDILDMQFMGAIKRATAKNLQATLTELRNLLDEGVNPNVTNNQEQPALVVAVETGLAELVRFLIEVEGINIRQTDAHGNDAIKIATLRHHTEILKILHDQSQ